MQKKIISHIAISYFIFAAVTLLLQQALSYILGVNYQPWMNNVWFLWAVSSVPMYFIAWPIAYGKIKQYRRVYIRKESMTVGRFFMFVCASIFIMYSGNIISNALCNAIQNATGLNLTFSAGEMLMRSGWIPNIAFTVIFAPIFEELIFRKMLIDRAIVLGDWTAIILSGLIFGLFHGNLNQLIYAAGLGCILAYVYIRTGNIWYSIGIHAIINFIGGVLPSFLMSLMSDELIASNNLAFSRDMLEYLTRQDAIALIGYNVYLYLVMFLGGTGILFLVYGRHKMITNPGEYSRGAKETFADMFSNVGMLLFIVICLYMFADSMGLGL